MSTRDLAFALSPPPDAPTVVMPQVLLESITDAIYVLDAAWRFTYLNPAAEALLGQPHRALLGACIWEAIPAVHGTVFEEHSRRAVATGLPATFEVFHSPQTTWLEVRAYPSALGLTVCCYNISARKEAEVALHERAQRDHLLVEQAADGLLIADKAGRIIEVNARLCTMLDYTRQALMGRLFEGLIDPDDLAGRPLRIPELLAGHVVLVERRWRRRDGTALHAESNSRMLADGRVQIIIRDIGERVAAEAALRASEASLAEAQRLAHLGSWEFDYASRAFRYSDEVYRIGGHAPRSVALTPATLVAAVHADDRERVRSALNGGLAGIPVDDLDYRIVRPDGEIRFVRTQVQLLRDLDGELVRLVGTIQDITERRILETRLAHQAFHDPLTGLPNRALFHDRLGHALARTGREGQICAVLFLDLDRFKTINDAFGHAAGDQFLMAVAARLGTVVRESDTLARLGGDEFAVLLEDVADLPAALRVAKRLHAALEAPITVDGRALVAGTSIGVALQSAPEDRPEELLRFADVALYRAKEAGRSCTEVFFPGMSAQALARLELERDLHEAIKDGQLILHYQPKVDLATGRIAGLEALVRWLHPARGLVPPGDFIGVAEETGLIVPLGRWVLHEACHQMSTWQARHGRERAPILAVNLSSRQFRHPDLIGDVAAALAAAGLPPAGLRLEITETVAMDTPDGTVAALGVLKALGVGLALDDFGSGYSSLAYLQRLPVDAIKGDRSFFAGGERNRAILKAVADLGHGLGLEVLAEGLETAEQVVWARGAGFDRGQGYYFARPLPPDEIEALWAAGLTFDLPAIPALPHNAATSGACGSTPVRES
jgi:diguanylate cyclase (GGDEF)-like protein/PAS domain S-box-containing protein